MYGLIKVLIEEYFGTPTYQVCILGPERTGKTVFTLTFSCFSTV